MLVYLHGSPDRAPAPLHILFACPASHLEGTEVPRAWVDHKNQPLSFQIEFRNGQAEVDSELGKYLVSHGLAFKTPRRQTNPWS